MLGDKGSMGGSNSSRGSSPRTPGSKQEAAEIITAAVSDVSQLVLPEARPPPQKSSSASPTSSSPTNNLSRPFNRSTLLAALNPVLDPSKSPILGAHNSRTQIATHNPPPRTPETKEEAKEIISAASTAVSALGLPSSEPRLVQSILDFLLTELNVSLKGRRYDIFRVPYHLEKYCWFVMVVCVDSFLHYIVLLPIRVVVAVITLSIAAISGTPTNDGAAAVDLLNGILWAVCFAMLNSLKVDTFYHGIKTHSFLKFYIIYKMLDLADILLTALGQDVLRSIYTSASVGHRGEAVSIRSKAAYAAKMVVETLIAISHILLHAFVKFVQVTTLHVAVNTSDAELLIIFITSNFVEIKANTLKRSNETLLRKHAHADCVERVQLVVFMCIIVWEHWVMELGNGSNAFTWVGAVLISEVVVDWFKHFFISNFNGIAPNVYTHFKESLCKELVQIERESVHHQHSSADVAAIFVGFPGIPMSCLAVRMLSEQVERIELTRASVGMMGMVWGALFTTKLVLSLFIKGYSIKYTATRSQRTSATS